MGKTRARSPRRQERPSLCAQEGVARLRELGVTGGDGELEALLEAVDFDVNSAAEIVLDRLAGRPATASRSENVATGADLGLEVRALSKASSRKPKHERRRKDSGGDSLPERGDAVCEKLESKRKDSGGDSLSDNGDALLRPTYAQLSQKAGHRLSSRVSLMTPEGQGQPIGIHYEAGSNESYDVDVLRMQQTHAESGSMRKIRREKKGVWRFDKKGRIWGVYPGEVSVELERIFCALGKGKGKEHSEVDCESIVKESRVDPHVLSDPAGFAQASLDDVEKSLEAAKLSPESVEAACEMLFSAAEAGGLAEAVRAGNLLESLVTHHGLKCHAGHARKAGLVVGSMRLLQVVLTSSPELCLMGIEIFDKKYPKLSLQDLGRKNCVRCLLARGMQLGSNNHVPQGKLLRKVEADAAPAWAQRYLNSMMITYPHLPQTIRDRVAAWVGVES